MLFRSSSILVRSHAKINVSLRVLGKNAADYHLLEMFNVPLELHDALEIDIAPDSDESFITVDDIALKHHMRANICTKALNAMRERFNFREQFMIKIHKEIPFAAGLGGGSSNAAALMRGIVDLLHLNTNVEELMNIGKDIGADVPFFLMNKPAIVKGIGEIVLPVNCQKTYFCLLIKPDDGLATKDVFEKYDQIGLETHDSNVQDIAEAFKEGRLNDLSVLRINDLEKPAISLLPEIQNLIDSLQEEKVPVVGMTGSGSTVFALFENFKTAKEIAKKYIRTDKYTVFLTRTML